MVPMHLEVPSLETSPANYSMWKKRIGFAVVVALLMFLAVLTVQKFNGHPTPPPLLLDVDLKHFRFDTLKVNNSSGRKVGIVSNSSAEVIAITSGDKYEFRYMNARLVLGAGEWWEMTAPKVDFPQPTHRNVTVAEWTLEFPEYLALNVSLAQATHLETLINSDKPIPCKVEVEGVMSSLEGKQKNHSFTATCEVKASPTDSTPAVISPCSVVVKG